MKSLEHIAKLLSDSNRIRMLLLLSSKELCVCQLMGILGISQPLVSRNLSLLEKGGFLEARRDGKLMFYKVKETLEPKHKGMLTAFQTLLADDETVQEDRKVLVECSEFQKRVGRCDMKTYKEFFEKRKKAKAAEAKKGRT